MKIKLRPAQEDSGISCLLLEAENEQDKQTIDNMFSQHGHVFCCNKYINKDDNDELSLSLRPQRILARDYHGKVRDIFEILVDYGKELEMSKLYELYKIYDDVDKIKNRIGLITNNIHKDVLSGKINKDNKDEIIGRLEKLSEACDWDN